MVVTKQEHLQKDAKTDKRLITITIIVYNPFSSANATHTLQLNFAIDNCKHKADIGSGITEISIV